MKKKIVVYGLLTVLLLAGLLVRLWNITTPLADWHSFRQADTVSVSREYVKHGIDLLRPRYQDLSNIQSGKDNPEGYRMVEFPIVNALVAVLYKTAPVFELHVLYRLVNVIFSLISALLLFVIFKRIESAKLGLLAAAVFLFLPYSVFYSRTTLPEIAMTAVSLSALWFGLRYRDDGRISDGLAIGLTAGLALLIKPVAIFLLLPLVPLVLQRKNIVLMMLIALSAVGPLMWWRQWIGNFPEGVPASDWLLNGNGIRFKGAFFYWLFAERIGKLMLGYWGLIFLGLGIISPKKHSFLAWWIIGALAYLIVFASGNVQHDYYQVPLLPVLSGLAAYGIHYLQYARGSFISRYGLLAAAAIFMVMFSWYYVRGNYNINNWAIVKAGKAVDAITPPDSLIIAPYMGDTAFLYQTNRRGWPIGFSIDKRIEQGADYYVSTAYDDEARELEKKYTVVEKTSDYILIKL